METLVLLSGGIDSAACVAFYKQLAHSVSGLFVDYSQPVCAREEKSATDIAAYYGIPLKKIHCTGLATNYAGEISGRNAFLVFAAMLFQPIQKGIVALGIHWGTAYYDCSESFVADLSRIISGYSNGKVVLGTPFLQWDKQMIYKFSADANVPVNLTWSCEIGPDVPCGRCLSCSDRKGLHVCTTV
jgi:7-cyano-7-deazaguanine synthase